MSDDLGARLADAGARREVDAELGARVRAGDLAGVEHDLRQALAGRDDGVARACLAVAETDVEVVGWEVLDAELTRATRGGLEVTAVGLDLSNYGDGPGEWWDKEPLVETAVHDDHAFPFSRASRQEVLDAGAAYAAPWTGRMHGVELTPLEVRGLRELNGWLLRRRSHDAEGDEVSDLLGWWWQSLRYQQAVARAVTERGLALRVPVVAGSHDVGPWLVCLHEPARVSDHLPTTERLLAEWADAGRAAYDAVTEETVAELVRLHHGLRGWGRRHRDERRSLVRYADARVALLCSVVGIAKPTRSVERMSRGELDRLVADYRDARSRR